MYYYYYYSKTITIPAFFMKHVYIHDNIVITFLSVSIFGLWFKRGKFVTAFNICTYPFFVLVIYLVSFWEWGLGGERRLIWGWYMSLYYRCILWTSFFEYLYYLIYFLVILNHYIGCCISITLHVCMISRDVSTELRRLWPRCTYNWLIIQS